MKSVISKYYPFLPLLLLCGYYGYKAIDFPIHDFANYYFGGRFLMEGHFNSTIYFPYEFNKAIFHLGHSGIFASYAPNTPFLAVFFTLFSIFSLAVAKLIFNGISVALLAFSLYRLGNYYKIDWRYAWLIPIVFWAPIKNNLLFGQVYFLLFFLLAEGWLAYEKKQWKSMSLFWSLAIVLKVFPVLLVVLLLFRKQWKPLFYLTFSCLILIGIAVLFTGVDLWFFYVKEVLLKASNGEIASAYVDNYQSVFMFLKRLLVEDSIENSCAFFNYPIVFSALMLAFKMGVLVLGYFISKRGSKTLFVFSYWILAMIILSPYGSTYTLILLLFSFFALVKSDLSMVKKGIFLSLLFLINNLPLALFIENVFPFSYWRLYLMVVYFGVFIALFHKRIHWKIVITATFFPMVLILLFTKAKPEKSTLVLEDSPILIYDYTLQTNSEINYFFLTASFWDGQEKVIEWNPNIKTFQPLALKNNQIFYKNQQLTFDNSHKLKPMLIDQKYILYLSDYGRGIGFYTLYKITLP
jgi:hypothetical protein